MEHRLYLGYRRDLDRFLHVAPRKSWRLQLSYDWLSVQSAWSLLLALDQIANLQSIGMMHQHVAYWWFPCHAHCCWWHLVSAAARHLRLWEDCAVAPASQQPQQGPCSLFGDCCCCLEGSRCPLEGSHYHLEDSQSLGWGRPCGFLYEVRRYR